MSKAMTGSEESTRSTNRSARVRATAPATRCTPCRSSDAVIAAIATGSSSSSLLSLSGPMWPRSIAIRTLVSISVPTGCA
jgi:hypothetical protein